MEDKTKSREELLEALKQLEERLLRLEQTKHKHERARAKLEKSHERVRIILDSITDGFLAVDKKWRITYLNRLALKQLERSGLPKEKLIGKNLWQVFPEAVQTAFYKEYNKAMSEQTTVFFEEFYPPLDGWFECHVYPTADGLAIYFRDVTKRKQMAEALLESEIRYRTLTESVSDAIISIDEESTILFANEAIKEIFGYTPGEIIGQSLTLLIPEHLRPKHRKALQDYVRTGLKRMNWNGVEMPGLHKNGVMIPLEISFREVVQRGKINFISIIRDISTRKRVEEALRKSEESFRHLFLKNPTPMWVFDATTLKFLEVNQATIDRYGYSREEFLKMRATDIRPKEDIPRYLDTLDSVGQRLSFEGQWRHRLKNGEMIDVEISAQRLEFDGRDVFLVAIQDVTRRKHEEKILRDSEARYRLFFEANPEPMFVYDLRTLQFLAVNNAMVIRYGYSREEFLAMTIREIRPPEDLPKLEEYLRTIPEEAAHAGVWRHCKKDGSILWVDTTGEVVEFEGHRARLIIAKEVTELVNANLNSAATAKPKTPPDIICVVSIGSEKERVRVTDRADSLQSDQKNNGKPHIQ